MFAAAAAGQTPHFRLNLHRLGDAVERVAVVTRRRFPDLRVPYHSRWRHFAAAGRDRAALVPPGANPRETVRARIDLAVVSVLLDAGAGPGWRYREAETGLVLARSEGLAVASLRAMQSGLFSADAKAPWRADAAALQQVSAARLAAAFQHGRGNKLAGLEGRAALLRRLGAALTANPDIFGHPARVGNLVDYMISLSAPGVGEGAEHVMPASELLRLMLRVLAPIWPERMPGLPPGDFGRHRAVPGDGLVPFHKLSQWLTYSLVEPLEAAGVAVTDLDGLTGLPEYRNGGLLIDAGVLEPRDPSLVERTLDPLDEAVVEWRALTVALLDRMADAVRARLGLDAAQLPLAKVLEGGTWAAGRRIAREKRADGGPPLDIESDGTVF